MNSINKTLHGICKTTSCRHQLSIFFYNIFIWLNFELIIYYLCYFDCDYFCFHIILTHSSSKYPQPVIITSNFFSYYPIFSNYTSIFTLITGITQSFLPFIPNTSSFLILFPIVSHIKMVLMERLELSRR